MSAPGRVLVLDDDLGMCRTIGDVLEADSRFLHKPFTPAGLGTMVRDVLDS